MFRLEYDWVGMLMGLVLQQVWLQGRDSFKIVSAKGGCGCFWGFGRSWVVCGSLTVVF